jgi:uncharacterized membrane protein YdbT with pleckstrin-like domain
MALEAASTEIDVVPQPVSVQQSRASDERTAAPTRTPPKGVMGKTEGVAFTDKVHDVLERTQEDLIWQGSPSMVLMVGLVLRYVFLIGVALSVPIGGEIKAMIVLPLFGLFVLQLVLRFLRLRTTKYRISTERIEITSGWLSRSTRTFEAHEAKDISIHRPFPISFLGAANLDVVAEAWAIEVLGVPADHAEAIRDAVRESGRREAARVDLIQWR